MRLKIVGLMIVFFFGVITCGLVYTQALKGHYFFNLSKNNRIRVVPKEARRGRIFDRRGVVLADNRISFNVLVVAQEVRNRNELFSFLSEVLQTDRQKLWGNFQQKTVNAFTPVVVAENIPKEKAMALEENKFRFPGLIIEVGFQRVYPLREVAAHVIGYVGKLSPSELNKLKGYGYTVQNLIGKSGIEEFYNSYLKGEAGGLQVEVNNRGEQVRVLGVREPVKGQDITLTMDSRIQKTAMDLLVGQKGAVVVMDLDKGEILAVASSPSFDPNLFVEGNRLVSQLFVDSLSADSLAPLLNRAVSGVYPPGSIFKVMIAICALENKKIHPQTTFFCPGYYTLGHRQFRCTHVHGVQNLTAGIAHSCNVYFYNIGLLLEANLINKFARMFGLGSATGVDLPYEARGSLPNIHQWRLRHGRSWSKGDMLNLSIGQGDIQVTPLQLVRMMVMVANGGRQVRPHLVKAIGSVPINEETPSLEKTIHNRTYEIVKAGLRAAVGDYSGTAHILDLNGLTVLGKTGTAQTSPNQYPHAWFVGFIPDAKTKMAFCVFLEHGGSSYYACQLARDLLTLLQGENIL